jgi:protein O-mannosyl-transferase
MAKNILVLVAFIFAVFSPCLKAGFINLDDGGHIVENSAVNVLSPSSFKQMFTQTINKTYIPLTTLSFALERYFFGFNQFVFHLDNLLLYTGVVILVMLLANRMGLSSGASFLAALIFAIHPMKVETVAWVTERKDVLYAFFYLLALHQYWSYLKTLSIKHYLATFFLGFLSILAKPMALSLPLILLVFDWFYGRRFSKRIFIEKLPILIYIVAIGWVTYSLNMRNPIGNIFQGALIWVWSLAFYLWKFLFPSQIYPYYTLPHPVSIFHWPYFLSAVFFLVLAALLVRFHKHKLFIFAFLYFFCSIFFLLRFDEKDFSVVSDRFMFLPSMGICFFAGAWVDKRIKTRWGTIIFYFFLVLMGIRTNLQCQVWHDSISFWNEVIREYPDYYRAYSNRGTALFQQERDDLALSDFNRAIALEPKAMKAYNMRGIIYYLRQEDSKALDDFNKAISLDPGYSPPYLNRSLLEEAHKNYRQALQDALYAKKLGCSVNDIYLNGLQKETGRQLDN